MKKTRYIIEEIKERRQRELDKGLLELVSTVVANGVATIARLRVLAQSPNLVWGSNPLSLARGESHIWAMVASGDGGG